MTPDERAARIHHHEYSGEGIREHAERIVALEELVMDMWHQWHGEYRPNSSISDSICDICESNHGGRSPCASTSRDMTDECCEPSEALYFAGRMTELGVIE